MNTNSYNFLSAIMGEDGASALRVASDRSEVLASAILPRSILGWLSFAARWGYEGEIPGLQDSYMQFAKSGEDAFDGTLTISDNTYNFNAASLLHLAAATAVALNGDETVDPDIKTIDVQRLGKNIDLLIGTRYLYLAKKAQQKNKKIKTEEVSKAEGHEHGAEAAPKPPIPPEFEPPIAKQPRIPKPKEGKQLNITKAQSEKMCEVCGDSQFANHELRFCYCLRDLKKFATYVSNDSGYTIMFGPEWSTDDLAILIDMMEDKDEQV